MVSWSAKTCPQCGAKDPSIGKVGYGFMQVVALGAAVVVGRFFWSVCVSGDSDEPSARPATTRRATTTTISERELLELAFDALVLGDPIMGQYGLGDLRAAGRAVCTDLDAGRTLVAVVTDVYESSPSDWDIDTSGRFVGLAVGAFCPHHDV